MVSLPLHLNVCESCDRNCGGSSKYWRKLGFDHSDFINLPVWPQAGRDGVGSSDGAALLLLLEGTSSCSQACPSAVLRAAGAVLPSCQRMVAALQESLLWWSVLFSESPRPLWISQGCSLTSPWKSQLSCPMRRLPCSSPDVTLISVPADGEWAEPKC